MRLHTYLEGYAYLIDLRVFKVNQNCNGQNFQKMRVFKSKPNIYYMAMAVITVTRFCAVSEAGKLSRVIQNSFVTSHHGLLQK